MKFQSPIGTNKTFGLLLHNPLVEKFQSPIGTNKTTPIPQIQIPHARFQSPIGTNKTVFDMMKSVKIKRVSIPYRYKQNPKMKKL